MMTDGSNMLAGGHIRSFIERIERLNEEKATLATDIREVFTEAKGEGFDTKIMRKVIRRRAMDPNQRREEDELLELYETSIESAAEPTDD